MKKPYTALLLSFISLVSVQVTGIGTVTAKTHDKYNISYDKTKRCPQYEADFKKYGLAPVEVFSYIAWRESRCAPGALNLLRNKDRSYDSGLLQINSSWKTVTSQVCGSKWGNMKALLNLDCNLKVAKFLLDPRNGGLGNWNIYKRS